MDTKVEDLSVFKKVLDLVGDSDVGLEELVYEMVVGDFKPRFGLPYSEVDWPLRDEAFEENVKAYEDSWDALEVKRIQLTEELGIEYTHIALDMDHVGYYGIFKLNGKVYRADYTEQSYANPNYDNVLHTLKEMFIVEKTIIGYE